MGRLAYRDRTVWLEFDDDFLASPLPISPVHHEVGPMLVRPHDRAAFEGLHGVFNDSLPDGWGRLLVDLRARQLDIEPATLSPVDRLACVGDRGMGALCYEPVVDVWDKTEAVADLDRLAAGARTVLEGGVGDVLSELGRAGGSPGGARPKALVAINVHGHAIHDADPAPAGHIPYLVKFRGAGDPVDAARIEQAYADMARAAGVRVPETRLLTGADASVGHAYFASQRFDRKGAERLHAHTASGLLYADARLPSLDYRDLISLTRGLTRDHRECRAMYTLAVFNVLAHNRDDHARQFTYLMGRDGNWRLAPAYDLTFAPGPGGEHSTSVLGQGEGITRDHLTTLGRHADLVERDIRGIIDRVTGAVADWERFASACDVGDQSRSRIATVLIRTSQSLPQAP